MYWLVRALANPLVEWRSTIFISYSSSASIFISYSIHQLQLPHPASLAARYPFPLIPKGERCSRGEMSLLGGAHLKGELVVSCHQWQRGRLLVSLSLAWSCMVSLSLMFVIDVNWIFDCGLVLGLGPLWSPSWVLFVVVSGRHFPHLQAQAWSHLEPLKWVKSPFGLGKSPFGCVCGLTSHYFYYFVMTINLIFS